MVAVLRDKERSSTSSLAGEYRTPSNSTSLPPTMLFMYRRAMRAPSPGSRPTARGHPPRTANAMMSSSLWEERPRIFFPGLSKSSSSDTSAVESPDSNRVIGRISMLTIRPVPLCTVSLRSGCAEPVRIYRPGSGARSTEARTASHTPGAACHSSTRSGWSPCSTESGSSRASRRVT